MIGFAVLKARRERNWSQTQLSKRCRVGVTTISRIERNHTVPSLPTLMRLSKALKVPLDELVAQK